MSNKSWIWSDLHLGHEKIIAYENRPFTSVEEMDKVLLKNWAATVRDSDTIINLGDFSMYLSKEHMQRLLRVLPGYKIIVLGNHDYSKSVRWWYDAGFNEVYKHPYLYLGKYLLSHHPIDCSGTNFINIHGHTHSQKEDSLSSICVSVEKTNYKPIDLSLLLK